MARVMAQSKVLDMAHLYFPSFLSQRENVERLDTWHRGEQEVESSIYRPNNVEAEYIDLMAKSPTPYLSLVVTAVVQNAELTGIRRRGSTDNMQAYTSWQRNRMDGKQRGLYTASAAHGLAFMEVLPGRDRLTGEAMSVMNPVSAKKMAAFYDDDDDEWAKFALKAEPHWGPMGNQLGWLVRILDDTAVHFIVAKGDGYQRSDWSYVDFEEHPAKVTPVVRYAPNLDIDGRANSDIAPLIPLASRIDQDTFDRLIVQRFGAWKVRYMAGLAKPTTEQEAAAQRIRLRMEDILIAEDPDTKFGTLDASDLAGFIAAKDADLRDMSAVSQTPPHHMLGLSSNLQAESLAAAEAGLQRKSRGHRTSWGESHEQTFRLDAAIRGDREEMLAFDMETRWRDNESRSLEQAAMSLGMLATNLKVPVEMLWERIPGWSDGDVERAKGLLEAGGIDAMLAELETIANGGQREPADAGA